MKHCRQMHCWEDQDQPGCNIDLRVDRPDACVTDVQCFCALGSEEGAGSWQRTAALKAPSAPGGTGWTRVLCRFTDGSAFLYKLLLR